MAGTNKNLLMRSAPFLQGEQPSPLSGGGYGQDSWEYFINEDLIMDFQNIGTFDDFVRAQDAIAERYHSPALTGGGLILNQVAPVVAASEPDEAEAPRIFVIMPFKPDWSMTVYEMIRRATQSLDLDPRPVVKRADAITDPGRITDQIIAEIKACDVIVADITGLNPNVMWELGYAHALEKPAVILNQDVDSSPFDLVDHRQVIYNSYPTGHDEHRVASFLRSALGF